MLVQIQGVDVNWAEDCFERSEQIIEGEYAEFWAMTRALKLVAKAD